MSLKIEMTYVDTGWGGRNKMTVTHNGLVVIEEYDGGEPEDQTLGRNWSWVEKAILKAYELGVKDGRNGRLPRSAED